MGQFSFKLKPVRFKVRLIKMFIFSLLGGALAFLSLAPQAEASGAFARQTGMSCTHCHTVRAPSMAAIGKMFFIQGFRTHIYAENRHGAPGAIGSGKEGGSFKLTEQASQYLWWRTRVIPYREFKGPQYEKGKNQDLSFAEMPSRFALGFGGPIGDYVSLWNEEYFQPYTESFNCDVDDPGTAGEEVSCSDHDWDVTGGNSPEYPPADGGGYHWRFSHVEVDELDIRLMKEVSFMPPGNNLGLLLSNRGRFYPNARGGSAITSGVGSSGAGDNGSVGIFGYNGSWLWFSAQLLPGNDVAWNTATNDGNDRNGQDGHDTVFTLYIWPWRQQQKDLSFDLYYASTNDANPSAGRNPFNHTNTFGDGQALNLRTNYVMADVGPHMLDTEINIGWAKQNYTSSDGDVEWKAWKIDPGIRYFWNRTFGIQVQVNLDTDVFGSYEQKVGGDTFNYRNSTKWDIELYYAMQPNALWYVTFSQGGGGVFCKDSDCPSSAQNNEPDNGWIYWLLLELNY